MQVEAIGGMILAFFIVALPFVFVTIILIIRSREKQRQDRLQAELYAKALEAGRDLPPDLFERPKKEKNSQLIPGIVLTAVGVGIALMGVVQGTNLRNTVGGAIIPLMLGIGFLVIYYIKRKQEKKDEE